ncbi:hypothetical protein J2X86_002955 [Acinetobacter lwoffii]|uniref:HNH endonuclease n=1 Tax=Acinetobacter lwoffii TaxID=28090 RepID=A0AAW8LKC8_ACILW|nr:hypothetical protein [Acinetobacter lwoffii]MDR6630892.1 hypothetical protein [Acinetobacter lwoffii]
MIGICKLCKKSKELQNSHIISKFVYKDFNQNNEGFFSYDSEKNIFQVTQRQFKKHLLCKECELIFSKNETKLSKILKNINDTDISDRGFFANHFPMNIQIEEMRNKYNEFEIDEKSQKALHFFDINKLNELKYFCLGTFLRDYYSKEAFELPVDIIEKIEKFFLNNQSLNTQMRVYIHTGRVDFSVSSTSHVTHIDKYYHFHFMFYNIFVYMLLTTDESIDNNFIVLPVDFFKPDSQDLPLIHTIDYYRKIINGSNISKNAKRKLNELNVFPFLSELNKENPL